MKKEKNLIILIICTMLFLAIAVLVYGIAYKGITFYEVPHKFGATYMTMNNPYFVTLNESIREEVEANGDILITRDPAQDQERQNQQILDMVELGVTAVFVNPVDWEEITPALKACQEAGVAVINLDTNVKDTQYVISVIQSNNYQAGVQCAKDMIKKKKEAKILIMTHHNIRSTRERIKGFKDTIADYPQYEIVEEVTTTSEFETAMESMNEIIGDGLDFDVVIGGNDPTALGALASLEAHHIDSGIKIYGVDGSPDAKKMIAKGKLEGSSAQSPIETGERAVALAYDYLEGKEVEKNIAIDVTMITQENLDLFEKDGWQ